MSGPTVTIDLAKIEQNAHVISGLCAEHGIEVTGVTKVTCGMPSVARAMLRGGVAGIGESRMENVRRLKVSGINAPMMLLRIPPLSAVDEIVTSVDISLNSELSVIAALSAAALRRGIVHDIILMVDLGDLREGIWPDDLIPIVSEAVKLPGIRIVGIGTNLSCYGGIIPTCANMDALVLYADEIEGRFNIKLRYLSGGNSSALTLIAEGGMPKRINHIRIGEGILLGRETVERRPWPETFQDAFVLRAEVIELKEKPSVPIGERGQDAFGGRPDFGADVPSERLEGARREMVRAILNVGREDVLVEGITPIDDRVKILGASSDHLIIDVTRLARETVMGGEPAFLMNYGALLAVMTSSYVEKRPIMGDEDRIAARGVAIIGVPGWVGAGEPGTDAAPQALREEGIATKLASLGLVVEDRGDVPVSSLIRGGDYDQNILEAAAIAGVTADAVQRAVEDGFIPLVLGGDHSISLGVLLGLSRSISPFGLIWFDAHGDFIPPNGQERRICRMVLGAALGAGDERLSTLGGKGPLVSPENVVIVGLRDVEQDEARPLTDSGVTIFTMEDIDAFGMKEVIYRALRAAGMGTRGVHVSLDIDVVDVQTAPGVTRPVIGGITYRETHLAMELLSQSGLIRSMDMAGIDMEADPEGKTARVAVEFILSAFGKKILGRS